MKNVYLNYHNLGYNPQFGINKVHPSIFRNHVNIVNHMVNLNPELKVVITFDDGYEGVYDHAFDLLSRSSVYKKIVFPITNYIGRYNDWDSTFFLNRYKPADALGSLRTVKYKSAKYCSLRGSKVFK